MSKREVLRLLEETNFPKQGRANIRRQANTAPEGFVLGKIINRGYTVQTYGVPKIDDSKTTQNVKYNDLHTAAKALMRSHNPNFHFSSIQVNKNNRTAKHIDGRNVGMSYMIGLGDYTGGDLLIYDEDGKNPKAYPTKNRWINFNGSIYPHETRPFRGTRYTLVYYDVVKKAEKKK